MSEQAPRHETKHHSPEQLVSHEHHERAAKHRHEQLEHAKHHEAAKNVEALHEQARAEALSGRQLEQEHVVGEHKPEQFLGVQQSLKVDAYRRTLRKAQSKLPKPARAFSAFMHNDTVETINSVGAQTIARPSGLLGGSICAFIGSVIVLYYSKHYGFRYNYLLLFLLFAGGFAIGSILELVIWSLHTRKQRY